MINKVTLIGRTSDKPELKTFESGNVAAKVSLATSEKYKDKNSGELKELTEWHSIVFWGKNAENAEKLIDKGSLVYIEGKIKSRKYTDKNGVERTQYDIECETFRLLSSSNKAGTEQKTNEENDTFDTFAANINSSYKSGEDYEVVDGVQKGKKIEIEIVSESTVSFKLNGEKTIMTKAKFDEFYTKMKKLSVSEETDLPF